MRQIEDAIYFGCVVHKRIRPCHHALRYNVFSLLLDCNKLDEVSNRCRLLSYNRFNLFSVYDRDHTEGPSLRNYLEDIARKSDAGRTVTRFMMLCYPRVLGYVFNPLTVYFGLDANDRVALVIYEVRNTFRGLQTYVLPAYPDENGFISQHCEKEFYVSPFNAVDGRYRFRVSPLGDAFTLGVALYTEDGPLLKTHFTGKRDELSDRSLIRGLVKTGWLTVKVVAGIHYEAAKLYLKGLRIVPRAPAPRRGITYVDSEKRAA